MPRRSSIILDGTVRCSRRNAAGSLEPLRLTASIEPPDRDCVTVTRDVDLARG